MLAPARNVVITRSQSGANGSLTTTLLSATSPVFVTVIVNTAFDPDTICCSAGSLLIWIEGLITSTTPADMCDTSGPAGGVPTTLTVFVKSDTTLVAVQT